jgi:two-component system phosphate regulon sensor histidine kinase PhoR
MPLRITLYLLCVGIPSLAGWWLGGEDGALAGVAAGSRLWLIVVSLRGAAVLRWLRFSDTAAVPRLGGLWGEVVDRARRALRARELNAQEAERRLGELLAAIQASPNGVVLLGPDGRIEWCNLTAAQHLGIDPGRDLQQLVGNLVRDPDFAEYYAAGDYSHETVMLSRESTAARPVRLSLQLHPYGEGRKLLLTRDITSIEQAETMRRDFVANVSHEIRTPLTVLTGFVETLQSLPLPQEERSRYLGLMAQQAQRMQSLVSDLLTLSRLEGSPLPGASEWTGAAVLQAQCEQEARALDALLGRHQQIRFSPAPAVEISGAAGELLSALANLVSNAVRYTASGGQVDVAWRQDGGRLEFCVRDSGPGISPEHIPRLTERFYRVDRSRSRETGGTGLGLAIVKHVVQRHGAELRIDSKVGEGSTFSIVFPASRVRPAVSASGARPATESQPG